MNNDRINCVLIDFDGTLTIQDTTYYLIMALLWKRPWLIFKVFRYLALIAWFRSGEPLQESKNACIHVLLQGLTNDKLTIALDDFDRSVQKLLRPQLLDLIKEKVINGYIVLVVTASPDFAVRRVLQEFPVTVVGTPFVMKEESELDDMAQLPCYGENKLKWIARWAASNSCEVRYQEAWSDAESDLPMMLLAERRYWVCNEKNRAALQRLDSGGEFLIFG